MPLPSKIGPFINIGSFPGHDDLMVGADTRIVKGVHNLDQLIALAARLPKTTFIYKGWHLPDDAGNLNDDVARWHGLDDPYGAARRWFDATVPHLQRIPPAYRSRFYVNISNEFADWSRLAAMIAFETECVRLLGEAGFRAAAGSFAVGTPEIVGDGDLHPVCYPLYDMLDQYRGLLSLHEYFAYEAPVFYGDNQAPLTTPVNWSGDYTSNAWHLCRYRQVWYKHLLPNFPGVRIVIGEFGAGAGLGGGGIEQWYGAPSGCWRDNIGHSTFDAYLRSIAWYDDQLRADPFAVGAVLYTCGDLDGSSHFDIAHEAAAFYGYIGAQNRAATIDRKQSD